MLASSSALIALDDSSVVGYPISGATNLMSVLFAAAKILAANSALVDFCASIEECNIIAGGNLAIIY